MQDMTALVRLEAADMLFCNGIGPIRRLEASIWSMFVCFGDLFFWAKKRIPKIGIPLRILGVSLALLSLLSMHRYTTKVVLSCTL